MERRSSANSTPGVNRRTNSSRRSKCSFPNLERAMDHPDMTEELAEILSTKLVRLEYRLETDIRINDE